MSTITFDQTRFDQTRFDQTRTLSQVRLERRPAAPRLRLTRRGKAVIVSLTVAVMAVSAVMFGPSSTATDQAGTPHDTTSVRVQSGHTLWQIAAEANPDGDIRATVDEIVELNSLPNASSLQMGSQIAVPVYGR